MTTKQQIVEMLKTRDVAIAKALVALNTRQTADEQTAETTRYNNGRGFRPCHARMGTSMAQFYLARGYLSPKQIAYWRQVQKDGKMRIEIYATQLLEVANEKQANTCKIEQPVDDVGNLSEERMALEEQLANEELEYGLCIDSDDECMLTNMEASIAVLRDRIDNINKEIARAYLEMSRGA